MSHKHRIRLLPWLLAAVVFGAVRLSADVVETKNGTRLVGHITKIDGGSIYLSTDFAGDIVVKQSEVTSLATDGPVEVRLTSGTRMEGTVSTADGSVRIVSPEGTLTTGLDKLAASWPVGAEDPQLVALERHWKYEATVNVNGTTGNQNQLGTQLGFDAKLAGPPDALELYTDYNRQVTNGQQSADQYKAGVDYSSDFDPRSLWYVRDEGGFDRIMDIRFYDTAAAGYGYDLIKNAVDTLTVRFGLAYRYDDYYNPATPIVDSAAGDFEIIHDLKFADWELGNKLTIDPAFSDFSNVTATQDSFYQIPLANPAWKLRLGVSNEYNSQPGPGIKKLDTTYYTQLILDWQ